MKFPTVFNLLRPFAVVAFITCSFLNYHPAQAQKTPAEPVYMEVQKPAQPVGGMQEFADHLSQNLTYPTTSLHDKVQGTVVVSFIVEKSGVITNAAIEKGLDEACNQEALRVVKISPKWLPAEQKGYKVRQKITLPVQFKIPDAAPATASNNSPTPSDDLKIKSIYPELPARPEGGTDAFFKYIQEKQHYPAKARRNNIQGKVMIEFMVEKDGSLSNFKVLKKLGNGLDEEAIRLVEKGPKWMPATVNGELVRQKMILPVIFQL